MTVECPKCGRVVGSGAFICPGCDYILDASFLGDDITDDERDRRPVKADDSHKKRKPVLDFGEDAMILGNFAEGAHADAEVSSFGSRDAGVSQREITQARFYFGGAVAQLMEPDAIPEVDAGVAGASIRMTPFERHVLGFINGRRSIGRIHKKSAMEETEFKTAIAMLADKSFIRLRGWKKPRPTGASAQSSLLSEVEVRPSRAPEPERTVVASMEQIEAMGRQQRQDRSRSSSSRRGLVPEDAGHHDTEHRQQLVTRAVAQATLTSPPVHLPRTRFASLQADLPQSEGQGDGSAEARSPNDARDASPQDPPAWEHGTNQSSVFANSSPHAANEAYTTKIPKEPEEPEGPDLGANAFDDGPTSGFAALRDPTGLGDSIVADHGGLDEGSPVQGDGDEDEDEDEVEDDYVSFVSAEALPSAHDALVEDEPDFDSLGPPRRIHDEVTAPPQALARLPAPAVVFEFDAPATQHIERPRPLTLPSEALMPALSPERKPASLPPAPVTKPQVALPGMGVPLPTPTTPSVTAPTPATAATPAPPQIALPGQALVTPGALGPPAAKKPLAPPARVSAASQVPFELRKKAERIYEQALKDQIEGRLSSALMNAKLAMNFDSTVPAYGQLFEALNKDKAKPRGPRPQELVLFEQASEAEGKGEYDKAAKLLQQAIAINPRAAALHNRLGVVLSIRLKRHDEALFHLKRAIELEPGSIVYMNNFSKVTGLLESVIQKGPQKKKKDGKDDDKVAIRTMRPKMF